MSSRYADAHHEDKTGRLIAIVLSILIFIAAAVGLSWNDSSKTAKKIVTTQATIDSLSKEIAWRQKVVTHHDSLQAIASDVQNFRRLPAKSRQAISAELAETSPKLPATKHNIQILEELLNKEKQILAELQQNKIYKIYH